MPRGSLTSRTVSEIETEIVRLCTAGFSAIEIDLRALHFPEPSGSRLIRRLHELTRRHGADLQLSAA